MKQNMKTMLLVCIALAAAASGLAAQNLTLEEAVLSSARTIEARLPQGSKAAVLVFAAAAPAFSDYIIDEIAIALGSGSKVTVIDRQYTDVIRRELNIQMSGDVSDEEVRSVGRQLGAQYVVTGSLVDIGTAFRFRLVAINVESAARDAASSVSLANDDPQVVFLLTGQRPAQAAAPPRNYRVGERGPGMGVVFFSQNGIHMECSLDLGSASWADAVTMARDHRGGGFADWRLPTPNEL